MINFTGFESLLAVALEIETLRLRDEFRTSCAAREARQRAKAQERRQKMG